jgi:N-methylhydantoinase B
MSAHPADPFTLDVIQQALAGAADEMFAILRKTAMSPVIYEVLDVGTGITDARGDLVSSGAGQAPDRTDARRRDRRRRHLRHQ